MSTGRIVWGVLLLFLIAGCSRSGSLVVKGQCELARADFTPPVIDGNLNESCWVNQSAVQLPLVNWTVSPWTPEKPPRDVLNGTLAVLNDAEYLYLAIRVFNATNEVDLRLYMDDNVTDQGEDPYAFRRGVVYWRENGWSHCQAGEMWLVIDEGIRWWSWGYYLGRPVYRIDQGGALESFVRWYWTEEAWSAQDVSYVMEGAFRFRGAPEDPPYLVERVPVVRLHLLLEVSRYQHYEGFYVFPPGSRRGASTEADIAQWYSVATGFPPFTPWVTPPPTGPPWLPVGLVVGAVFAVAGVGLFLQYRRRTKFRVVAESTVRG